MRPLVVLAIVAMGLGCAAERLAPGDAAASAADPGRGRRSSPGLRHEAYVWQRAWTGAVREAVRDAPAELAGLRVQLLEVDRRGQLGRPGVDAAALAAARRPVTAVVRIDGARLPAGVSLAPALDAIAAWRRAGVPVVGLEIDHDCATAALPAYAAWLAAARPPGLRFSATALPTWAGAPGLGPVAAAVDELVVQLHAVRAPALFEPAAARRGLERFAAAVPGARLRVALPTYAARVDGADVAADPDEVADLLRSLERAPVPGVTGVVWFRLPVAGDHAAWPSPVLAAVIRGPRPAALEAP